ncbi:MAG: hypothetical protein GU356_05425 [Pyrobaculum sp.]|nr:hypothetical protein [Pyrobaculum sp.]
MIRLLLSSTIEPGAYAETTQAAAAAASAALEELLKFAEENRGQVLVLAVIPDDLYNALDGEVKKRAERYVLPLDLRDAEFLTEIIYEYSGCRKTPREKLRILAEKIAQLDGGYTLAARYAGLWLRDNGCKVESVERAVEEAKREPRVFFAHYIWHVLLRGSGDLARKVAVPPLLHAVFGPVPVGVTYVTKAVYHGVWRFLKPEELEDASLESLREEALEPIAKWLAQQHEDLVEEALRDLASLNGEETKKPYKKALSDLIKALDWARGEVLKEGAETLAKLGVPEEGRISAVALLAFVVRRLAAVFKSGEVRGCWRRAAFIAGFALAGYLVLPTTKPPEHVAEVLGDVSESCAVDDYLAIDGVMPPLSIGVAQLMSIRELNMLTPYTDAEIIKATKKTAERLLARWRRGDITLAEAIYALGLAALAAGGEVDGETADLLLYAASSAVQWVAYPRAVLPVLAALRSLGEKAPHSYVSLLATVSELRTLDQETVWYLYDALQQLRSRLLEAERFWPLVEAVAAYSNLLRKYSAYIWDRRGEAVADMCQLYSEIRRRSAATAPGSGLSAHRLFDTTARARVLAVALESDDLARHVQRYCGIGDLEREVEAVRSVLDEAAAHPEELSEIAKSDADYAEWVERRNVTGNAGGVVENVSAWFKYVLARYKLVHALDEKGELDEKKLEEAAEDFEKEADMQRKLKQLENYMTARSLALRARILAAKSWGELLERAKGFQELWKEAEKHPDLIAEYLATAAGRLSEYLVYLAASGDKEMAEELLKKLRQLLDYRPEVSVATRLMLRLLGVGEGARLKEVVDVFESLILPEFRPAISMLAGRLQRDRALEECAKLFKTELCVNAVAAAAGDRVTTEILRSVIEKVVAGARPLLDRADGRTLVEVLTPISSAAQLVFMLLAAVEGRADAIRLHGLLGSVAYGDNVNQPLFRTVYKNCDDLNNEGCRLALLKLYYYHF